MRYRWNDFVSNGRLLREDDSTFITRMSVNTNSVYTDMWPEGDPAHWVVSVTVSPEWRRQRERPLCSQPRQVDRPCQNVLKIRGRPALEPCPDGPQEEEEDSSRNDKP